MDASPGQALPRTGEQQRLDLHHGVTCNENMYLGTDLQGEPRKQTTAGPDPTPSQALFLCSLVTSVNLLSC